MSDDLETGSASPPTLTAAADDAPAWLNFAKSTNPDPTTWPVAWKAVAVQIDRRRTCGSAESIQWVFDHAGIGPEWLNPDSVPSRGAIRMLMWVQESETNYGEFIKHIWSKT